MTRYCTAFIGTRFLESGDAGSVAAAVKAALERGETEPILVFDDDTGRAVDFDLRGSADEIRARLAADAAQTNDMAPRGRGRPKIGVVAREVTLLPRHWEWLNAQPGGASVTLRKLVDAARKAGANIEPVQKARENADRFMSAMAGNLPGYEEAARALYAGAAAQFAHLTEDWPADVRDYARRLAAKAFEETAASDGQMTSATDVIARGPAR